MMKKATLAALVAALFVGVVAVKQFHRRPAAPTATQSGSGAACAGSVPSSTPVATGDTANERALAQAKAEHKPVVLSFRSNSCRPCVAMGRVLGELKPKYGDRVAFVDVSLDDTTPDAKLIQQHEVRVKPTTVVLTKDGNLADTHIGLWPAAELSQRLDALAGR